MPEEITGTKIEDHQIKGIATKKTNGLMINMKKPIELLVQQMININQETLLNMKIENTN